jgi:prepilin-type N-terminal cleavage/methylation domain-containing protein
MPRRAVQLNPGFTLIELVIAIVIFGLLLGMMLPLANGAVTRVNVRSARAQAITLYQRARAAALESGRSTTLSFSADVGLVTATPRLAGPGTVDTIGYPVNFGASFGVTVSGTPAPSLTVDPRGFGSSTATLLFSRNGVTDSMVVSDFGRIFK